MSNTLVCFTGGGDIFDRRVRRYIWEDACDRLGWEVVKYPYLAPFACGILVASRDDTKTKKAQLAKEAGWDILTYEEFAGHLFMNGITELDGLQLDGLCEAAQRERERQAAADRVAAKQEQRRREAEELEKIPGWGAWG